MGGKLGVNSYVDSPSVRMKRKFINDEDDDECSTSPPPKKKIKLEASESLPPMSEKLQQCEDSVGLSLRYHMPFLLVIFKILLVYFFK